MSGKGALVDQGKMEYKEKGRTRFMIDKDKIKNYYKNEYSSEEELNLCNAFTDESNLEDLRTEFNEQWDHTVSENTGSHDLDHLLHKINYLINSSTQSKKIRPFNRLTIWYARIAAVLLIPILLYVAIATFTKKNSYDAKEGWAEMKAPLGARIKFMLPDSTIGWLNSGSSIKYALNFNKDRKIQLSGEAFFNVMHRNNDKFIVKTKYLDVEVKGTCFDVAAYEGEELIDITLEQGCIVLKNEHISKGIEMKPNEQVSYRPANLTFTKKIVSAQYFSAWKEGKLMLRNASLVELAKQLSRWYNVDVMINNNKQTNSLFRATFEDENLYEVLRLLKLSSNLDYTIDERIKLSDGTFSRQHVFLKNN